MRKSEPNSKDIPISENAELLRQCQRLTQRIDFVPSGIFETDASGNCIFVNETWCQLAGVTFSEAMGSGWVEAIHPDDRESVIREWEASVLEGRDFDFVFRFQSKKGSETYVHSRSRKLIDSRGVVVGHLGSTQNMTEQRKAQEELNQTSFELNQFFSLAEECLAITDREAKVKKLNPAALQTFGYSLDELLGESILDFVHPDDLEATLKHLAILMNGSSIAHFEHRLRCKNGAYKMMNWVVSPDPVTGNLYAAGRDMTEIRMRELELQESERLLEEAQRAAKIGSWSFNTESREIRWSRQMYGLFPADPIKGVPTYEQHFSRVHPEDQLIWKSTIESCLSDGAPFRVRFRSLFPDRELWIEMVGEGKADSQGKIVSLGGTCQDVSALVAAEQLAQRERGKALQSAKLASLGEMSAGIAHEINNPLAIIKGTANMMQDPGIELSVLRSKADVIERASDRISKIVKGLRKFSRSSEKCNHQKNSIAAIVEEAIVLTGVRAKRAAVSLDVAFKTDALVTCNEIEIEQVLINLINNSIDAVADLQEKWVKIEVLEHKNQVLLRVRDSGKGIAKAVQEKLFQPFFTTKAVGEGTGLGLSIVKGILDEHRATIELLCDESHTCFEIRFDIALGNQSVA